MLQVTWLVSTYSGEAPYAIAKRYRTFGGHASVKYGYATVARAIRAGLILAFPHESISGASQLYLSSKGERALDNG